MGFVKGHEGRRRATKGMEKTQEGSAKGWEGEPFAKFAVEHDILLANVMFRL